MALEQAGQRIGLAYGIPGSVASDVSVMGQ